MAALPLLLLLSLVLAPDLSSSQISPAPSSGGPLPSPLPSPPSRSAMPPLSPSPTSNPHSPPAPPPRTDDGPSSAPSPPTSPAPAPAHEAIKAGEVGGGGDADEEAEKGGGGGGMSAGKKTGIALGVLVAAAVVGVAAMVYKKRKDNIQRSRYGYATRRDLI